jgi:hypothetical protein
VFREHIPDAAAAHVAVPAHSKSVGDGVIERVLARVLCAVES